jgi:hypothetical protein
MYTDGSNHTLATGTTTALGTGTWHKLRFTFQDAQISAAVDGNTVGSVTDTSFQTGQAGLGIQGYRTDQFDNLSITPGTGVAKPPTGPIASGQAGKCVDDYTGSTTVGAKVDLWDCNNTGAQQWTFTGGTLEANGLCLDITGGGTANGTLAELWTCTGGSNQQWQASNGALVNPATGKCLDDPGFNTTNGTQLDIWTCDGGTNQHWTPPGGS